MNQIEQLTQVIYTFWQGKQKCRGFAFTPNMVEAITLESEITGKPKARIIHLALYQYFKNKYQ